MTSRTPRPTPARCNRRLRRARAQGQLGDVKKGSVAQVEGEGKLLTAKGSLQGGATVELKDGKLERPAWRRGRPRRLRRRRQGVRADEGVRAAFVNWGISFNGKLVPGALLTAEAKASAMAGFKDGKWTFGFGAKIGAALAGLGFEIRLRRPRSCRPRPAGPPGIPGFAGIDPIAKGCFTVLVGGMPPPYIPGPPTKEDYGGHVIARPGETATRPPPLN